MSKAVLISINPKWCAMIASGEKTVEIRKNRPQIKPPFKCYIYCTKGRRLGITNISNDVYEANGSVIGEFVCDRLDPLPYGQSYNQLNVCFLISAGARLKAKELYAYAKGKTVYGWHIFDLKIYDTPKELQSFMLPCTEEGPCAVCRHAELSADDEMLVCENRVQRPPQSWMYIDD